MGVLKRLLLLLAFGAYLLPAAAAAQSQDVQTAWRLLDYIAVDYREAVQGGRIVNQLEYDEMVEFSASVSERLKALPAKPAKAQLMLGAAELQRSIAAKSPPEDIDRQARSLASALLRSEERRVGKDCHPGRGL